MDNCLKELRQLMTSKQFEILSKSVQFKNDEAPTMFLFRIMTEAGFEDYDLGIMTVLRKIVLLQNGKKSDCLPKIEDTVIEILAEEFVERMVEEKIIFKQHREIVKSVLINNIKLLYQDITERYDIPPPFLLLNEIFRVKAWNIYFECPNSKVQLFADVHERLVDLKCQWNENSYKPLFINDISNFKYLLFADGRTRGTQNYECLSFNKDRTPTNTFYVDIDPGCTPDSISNLKNPAQNIIYNGTSLPHEMFDQISVKAAFYNAGSLLYNGANLDINLFENFHKYLRPQGILEILQNVNSEDLVKISHWFVIKEMESEHLILCKI